MGRVAIPKSNRRDNRTNYASRREHIEKRRSGHNDWIACHRSIAINAPSWSNPKGCGESDQTLGWIAQSGSSGESSKQERRLERINKSCSASCADLCAPPREQRTYAWNWQDLSVGRECSNSTRRCDADYLSGNKH